MDNRIDQDFKRYSRQIAFPPMGKESLEKLKESKVCVIGCGALGCSSLSYLVRSGVGYLRFVDRDYVEIANLPTQILFDEEDVKSGIPKAIAAQNKLKKINSLVSLDAIVCDVNSRNIEKIIQNCDLVVDATDNFEIRFLINEACVKNQIFWIYGAIIGSYGMTFNIFPGSGPCLNCLIPVLPLPGTLPTCETAGVINPISNVISSIQVAEALKILLGDENKSEDLVFVDVWWQEFQQIKIKKNDDCEVCGKKVFKFLEEGGTLISSLCGSRSIQIVPPKSGEISLEVLAESLKKVGEVSLNPYILHFKVENYQISIFTDGRALIKGTTNENVARSLYAKYVGF